MTITVSISDLRNNIAKYLEQAANGVTIIVRDEKKDKTIAQIVAANTFDKNRYEMVLRDSAGALGDEHTEWKNEEAIKEWLTKSRQDSERTFY